MNDLLFVQVLIIILNSMKNLVLVIFSLFLLCTGKIEAQTYYYKLISYGKSGTENTKVSGGQFITFQAVICMETDKSGVSIGTGYLHRQSKTHNTYVGSANWGSNTTFEFASDKSTLRVIAPDGLIYKYRRSNPPNNVTTCSLTKFRSSNNGGSAGGGVYIPVQTQTNTPQKCGICYGSGKCSTCNGTGISSAGHAHICGACGGTGRCATCAGSGYSSR